MLPGVGTPVTMAGQGDSTPLRDEGSGLTAQATGLGVVSTAPSQEDLVAAYAVLQDAVNRQPAVSTMAQLPALNATVPSLGSYSNTVDNQTSATTSDAIYLINPNSQWIQSDQTLVNPTVPVVSDKPKKNLILRHERDTSDSGSERSSRSTKRSKRRKHRSSRDSCSASGDRRKKRRGRRSRSYRYSSDSSGDRGDRQRSHMRDSPEVSARDRRFRRSAERWEEQQYWQQWNQAWPPASPWRWGNTPMDCPPPNMTFGQWPQWQNPYVQNTSSWWGAPQSGFRPPAATRGAPMAEPPPVTRLVLQGPAVAAPPTSSAPATQADPSTPPRAEVTPTRRPTGSASVPASSQVLPQVTPTDNVQTQASGSPRPLLSLHHNLSDVEAEEVVPEEGGQDLSYSQVTEQSQQSQSAQDSVATSPASTGRRSVSGSRHASPRDSRSDSPPGSRESVQGDAEVQTAEELERRLPACMRGKLLDKRKDNEQYLAHRRFLESSLALLGLDPQVLPQSDREAREAVPQEENLINELLGLEGCSEEPSARLAWPLLESHRLRRQRMFASLQGSSGKEPFQDPFDPKVKPHTGYVKVPALDSVKLQVQDPHREWLETPPKETSVWEGHKDAGGTVEVPRALLSRLEEYSRSNSILASLAELCIALILRYFEIHTRSLSSDQVRSEDEVGHETRTAQLCSAVTSRLGQQATASAINLQLLRREEILKIRAKQLNERDRDRARVMPMDSDDLFGSQADCLKDLLNVRAKESREGAQARMNAAVARSISDSHSDTRAKSKKETIPPPPKKDANQKPKHSFRSKNKDSKKKKSKGHSQDKSKPKPGSQGGTAGPRGPPNK